MFVAHMFDVFILACVEWSVTSQRSYNVKPYSGWMLRLGSDIKGCLVFPFWHIIVLTYMHIVHLFNLYGV